MPCRAVRGAAQERDGGQADAGVNAVARIRERARSHARAPSALADDRCTGGCWGLTHLRAGLGLMTILDDMLR